MIRRTALIMALAAGSLAAGENLSVGLLARWTTWNVSGGPAQTPGWIGRADPLPYGHPGGDIDIEYKIHKTGLFGEVYGDPHRSGEATGIDVGLRRDFFHYKRFSFYGQASAGAFKTVSWLEYCWSYEYQNGDCHAGDKPPEICWWFNIAMGAGPRLAVTKHVAIEGRIEYLDPYSVGPRWGMELGLRIR